MTVLTKSNAKINNRNIPRTWRGLLSRDAFQNSCRNICQD